MNQNLTRFEISCCWQADASIRQKANWFSLEDLLGDKTRDQMGAVEGDNYDSLLRNLTNVRELNPDPHYCPSL